MKKLIIPFLLTFVLTACSVDSPISTVQTVFKQIQAKNFQAACQMMVNPKLQTLDEAQLKSCVDYYQKDYANLASFSVENALPLTAEKLKDLNTEQGFEVFYTVNLSPEVKHEKANVIKVGGKHLVVWEKGK